MKVATPEEARLTKNPLATLITAATDKRIEVHANILLENGNVSKVLWDIEVKIVEKSSCSAAAFKITGHCISFIDRSEHNKRGTFLSVTNAEHLERGDPSPAV